MIGTLVILGWAVVGVIVASVEKSMRRGRNTDNTMLTVLCVAGAVVGGIIGQTFRLYVFGEILGFVFAAAGAELLLFLYRSGNAPIRPSGEAAVPPPVVPAPPATPVTLGIRFLEAFAWGVLCALAVAITGFFSHLVGGRLYPQRYEQIPSDFFFVPLGLIIGFVFAATARLARPHGSVLGMFAFVALVTIGYGGLMFGFARSNARPAQLTVALDPNPANAVNCDPAACPQADPPLEWTVQGYVRVQETAGLGGTVDAISLFSYEEIPYRPPTSPRETAAELQEWNKFAGPRIRLTGRQIIGAHHVRPNEIVSYPIRYSYRTRRGDSERSVSVYVEFTDAAGRGVVGIAQWKVW